MQRPAEISRAGAASIPELRPAFLALHEHHRGVSAIALTEPDDRAWSERAATYHAHFGAGQALLHVARDRDACVGYAFTILHEGSDDTFPLSPRYAELYTLAVLPPLARIGNRNCPVRCRRPRPRRRRHHEPDGRGDGRERAGAPLLPAAWPDPR